jgi:hypothetical protein
VGRKVKLFVGLSLVIAVALWLANHRGLFRQGSALAATASATTSRIPSTTQRIASIQNPPPFLARPPVDEDTSTFIALRYDKTHVIFRLGDEGDFFLDQEQEKTLRKVRGPIFRFGDERALYSVPEPTVENGEAQIWELGPKLLQGLRANFNKVHVGEQWQLELSGDSRIPVVVQKPVALGWGCDNSSYTAVFIAEAAPQAQPVLASDPKRYFLVHNSPGVFSPESPKQTRVGALPGWNPTPEIRTQVEQAIDAQLKDELAQEQARGVHEEDRKQFGERQALGKVKLTYETEALQLSPDGFPLLFVRARWMTDQQLALLMTFWLHLGPTVTSEAVGESGAQDDWMFRKPPFGEEVLSLNQLGHVLNVFDRHGDGYGEVLVFFPGYEGYTIQLFRYTPAGLVATKVSQGDGC